MIELEKKKLNTIIYPLRDFTYQYNGPSFVRGEGMFLYDEAGKRYLDCISGLWNVSFGYAQKQITEVIISQLNSLPFVNLYSGLTPMTANYADKLVDSLNGDYNRMFYTCSGSESIEWAIKTARKYYRLKEKIGKNKVAIFDYSYHGTTYAAMSASGIDDIEKIQYAPVVEGFIKLEIPYDFVNRTEDLDFQKSCITNLMEAIGDGNEIAAFLLEPVLGSAGVLPIPDWYIKEIKKLSKEKDILIIFDEVATGFGRTGAFFAYQNMDISPDMLCLSKGIDNGVIPMGCVLINRKTEELFYQNRQYIEHFSTQNGNPLACAAASVVLDILKEEGFCDNIQKKGRYLETVLKEKLLPLNNVREIRAKGLMLGIDLVNSDGSPYSLEKLTQVQKNLLERGLLVYPFVAGEVTGGFSLFPSYVITEKIIEKIGTDLLKVLNRYE